MKNWLYQTSKVLKKEYSTYVIVLHTQTDGQTEVVNKSIEDYLRHFGDENQTDWDTLLPYASFAFNNSLHEST